MVTASLWRAWQEASGYAATLADLTGEVVLLVPFFDNTPQELQRARFTADGVLEVRTGERLIPIELSEKGPPHPKWQSQDISEALALGSAAIHRPSAGSSSWAMAGRHEALLAAGRQVRPPRAYTTELRPCSVG